MARAELFFSAGFVLLASGAAAQASGCRPPGRNLRADCDAVAAHLAEVGETVAAERWDAEHNLAEAESALRVRLEPAQADRAIDVLVSGWREERDADLAEVRGEMSVLARRLVPACVDELRDSPDRERVVSCLLAASDASEINGCGEVGFLRPKQSVSR
ncbi:MAG: hypothetical protein ACRBN8_33310 [Nannocystales bacterium]